MPLANGRRTGEGAVALAAAVLAAAALGAGGLRGLLAAPVAACATPFELAAEDGFTRVVGCGAGTGPPLRGPARLLFGQKLDLNCADPLAFEALPGIGPARAAAIARARRERPFARVEELVRVRGIGPATLRAVSPRLEVGAACRDARRVGSLPGPGA